MNPFKKERRSLLGLAKADLKAARQLIGSGNDEELVNIAAYHLSQCTEKTMKFELGKHGVDYRKTHDICDLRDACILAGVEVPEVISEDCKRIRDWAVQTRYNGSYFASIILMQDVIPALSSWIDEIERGIDLA